MLRCIFEEALEKEPTNENDSMEITTPKPELEATLCMKKKKGFISAMSGLFFKSQLSMQLRLDVDGTAAFWETKLDSRSEKWTAIVLLNEFKRSETGCFGKIIAAGCKQFILKNLLSNSFQKANLAINVLTEGTWLVLCEKNKKEGIPVESKGILESLQSNPDVLEDFFHEVVSAGDGAIARLAIASSKSLMTALPRNARSTVLTRLGEDMKSVLYQMSVAGFSEIFRGDSAFGGLTDLHWGEVPPPLRLLLFSVFKIPALAPICRLPSHSANSGTQLRAQQTTANISRCASTCTEAFQDVVLPLASVFQPKDYASDVANIRICCPHETAVVSIVQSQTKRRFEEHGGWLSTSESQLATPSTEQREAALAVAKVAVEVLEQLIKAYPDERAGPVKEYRARCEKHTGAIAVILGPSAASQAMSELVSVETLCRAAVSAILDRCTDLDPICNELEKELELLPRVLPDIVLSQLKRIKNVNAKCVVASICSDPNEAGVSAQMAEGDDHLKEQSHDRPNVLFKRAVSFLRHANMDHVWELLEKIEPSSMSGWESLAAVVDWKSSFIVSSTVTTENVAYWLADHWLAQSDLRPTSKSSTWKCITDKKWAASFRSEETRKLFGEVHDFVCRAEEHCVSSSQVLSTWWRHWRWATLAVEACQQHPQQGTKRRHALRDRLRQQKESIPVDFLSFLALSEKGSKDDADAFAEQYRSVLRQGRDPREFSAFLPAQDAAEQRAWSGELQAWLEKFKDGSEKEQKLLQDLEKDLAAANLNTFPDCLGEDREMIPDMVDAIRVFRDDAHRFELMDTRARALLKEGREKHVWRIPVLARMDTEEVLQGVFAGKIPHASVCLKARVFEQLKPMCDLLGTAASTEHPSAMTALTIMQLRPDGIQDLARTLSRFFKNLQLEDPKALDSFLMKYGAHDLGASLPVFGDEVDVKSREVPVPVAPSFHDMVVQFQDLLSSERTSTRSQVQNLLAKDSEAAQRLQRCWKQINYLSQLAPLLAYFRTHRDSMDDEGLKRKMAMLRIMCVTNRSMTKRVEALDNLAPFARRIALSSDGVEVLDTVGKLLECDVLANTLESGTNLEKLCFLFDLEDTSIRSLKRNCALLRKANFVILAQDLCKNAINPLSSKRPAHFVSICHKEQSDECFRLAGGKACKKLNLWEAEALFTEIQLQVQVREEQVAKSREMAREDSEHGDDPKLILTLLGWAEARLKSCARLAKELHDSCRVGCAPIERTTIKFSMEPPEKRKGSKRNRHDHDIEDCRTEEQNRCRPVRDDIESVQKRDFPWLSWAHPLSIMKPDPWVEVLIQLAASMAASTPSEGPNNSDILQRLCRASKAVAGRNSVCAKLHGYKHFQIQKTSERHATCVVTVSLVSDVRDQGRAMTTLLGMLSAGNEGSLMPTSLFPCDSSAVSSAVSDFAWRLKSAAKKLEYAGDAFAALDQQDDDMLVLGVQHILCSHGVALTRPDTLPPDVQDELVAAIQRYSCAAARFSLNPTGLPKIHMLLGKNSPGRFTELLRLDRQVQVLPGFDTDAENAGTSNREITTSRPVWLILMSLADLAHGLRPHLQQGGYRIKVGMDTRASHLVHAVLHLQKSPELPLILDFGSDFAWASGPLGSVVMSLILTGVVGQAQHQAAVLPHGAIYIEYAVQDGGDPRQAVAPLFEQLPFLAQIKGFSIKDVRTASHRKAAPTAPVPEVHPAFQKLIERCNRQPKISDRDVENALKAMFNHDDDCKATRRNASDFTPFIHTAQTLRLMATVASRLPPPRPAARESTLSLPILLTGDTGTGKTYLLLKLDELLFTSGVYQEGGYRTTWVLSAAFGRAEVESKLQTLKADLDSSRTQTFLLDELTSSPAQEALSRFLCSREIRDGSASQCSFPPDSLLLATCNPDPKVHDVFDLTPEMKLSSIPTDLPPAEGNRAFIRTLLEHPKRGPGLSGDDLETASLLVLIGKWCAESTTPPIGTVSLRDAVRCAVIAKGLGKGWARPGKSFFDELGDPPGGWAVRSETLRQVAIACHVCFGMRVLPRQSFYNEAKKGTGLEIKSLVAQAQDMLVAHGLVIHAGIETTPALKDNLLAGIVAIASRVPLLCLGDDGTSKTLALGLLLRQMQGKFSQTPLLQGLPCAQVFQLQLSENTSARHIEDLKETIRDWETNPKLAVPCVFMEEMSMALSGSGGALRALHDLLDLHQTRSSETPSETKGTGSNNFAFLATSNFRSNSRELPVGRALGNRFLVLAHEQLDPTSLVKLAVNVGLADIPESHTSEVMGTLSTRISALCNYRTDSTTTWPDDKRTFLVPTWISIRSLLYYTKTLALSLSQPKPLPVEWAEARAFAAHLQLITKEQTQQLWRHLVKALGWSEEIKCPNLHQALTYNLESRTRRPILLLYNSPREINALRRLLDDRATRVQQTNDKGSNRAKINKTTEPSTCICPMTLHAVSRSRDQAESGGSILLAAMLKLRAAVESGGRIYILNPQLMLDGIHALLNDASAETSTLQIRKAYENVRIHPTTQIVLLVHRGDACLLHKALLSRVAVGNCSFVPQFPGKEVDIRFANIHSKLLRFYERLEGGHGGVSKSTETEEKEQGEIELLNQCEKTLEDVKVELLQGLAEHRDGPAAESNSATPPGLTVVLVRGSVPSGFFAHERVTCIAAVDFDQTTRLLEKLEEKLAQTIKAGDLFVLNFAGARPVVIAEILTLLQLSGIRSFYCKGCPEGLGEAFKKLWREKGVHVILLVEDVAADSAIVNVKFKRMDRASGKTIEDSVRVVETTETRRAYPGWPSMAEIAKNPDLVKDLARDEVLLHLNSVSESTEASAVQLRKELCSSVLRLCLPAAAAQVLLDPALMPHRPASAARDMQERERERTKRFKDLVDLVLRRDSRSVFHPLDDPPPCLRSAMIEAVRAFCCQASTMFLQRVPLDLIDSPDQFALGFIDRVLTPCTFSWQQHYFSRSALVLHAELAKASGPAVAARCSAPFLADIMKVLDGGPRTHKQVRKALSQAFPLPHGSNSSASFRLQGQLIKRVAKGLMEQSAFNRGRGRLVEPATAESWLCAVSDGTLDGMLATYYKHEAWLVVASFLQASPDQDKGAALEAHFQLYALRATLDALDGGSGRVAAAAAADAPKQARAHCIVGGQTRAFMEAVRLALSTCAAEIAESSDESARTAFKRVSQYVSLWNLHWQTSTSGEEWDPHVASRLLFDGSDVTPILEAWSTEERGLLVSSALDHCDSLLPLPEATIATAVRVIGLARKADRLLTSSIMRRPDLRLRLEYANRVVHAMVDSSAGTAHPALLEATCIARASIGSVARACCPVQLLQLTWQDSSNKTCRRSKCHGCHALRLAVAAEAVPELVRSDRIVDSGNAETLRRVFHATKQGGTAIRHLLVKELIERWDEKGLSACWDGSGPSNLPKVVGDWISPFLQPFSHGMLLGLHAVPGFTEALGDRDLEHGWFDSMQSALGVAGTSHWQPAEELRASLELCLREEQMAFCAIPLVVWSLCLSFLAADSPMASRGFQTEQGLDRLCVPSVHEGQLEMLHRMRQVLGIQSINRCPCGFVYGIGNCGQPNEGRRCPKCGGPIGGRGTHSGGWLGGDHGTGMANADDSVRGIPLDWFHQGGGYTERDLRPMEYRVLCVLMLLPLAAFSPSSQRRREQLRLHWAALRDVGELSSDSESQRFLMGVLVNAVQRGSLHSLAMGGQAFQSAEQRLQSEKTFAEGLRRAMNNMQPRDIAVSMESQSSDGEVCACIKQMRPSAMAALDETTAAEQFAPKVFYRIRDQDTVEQDIDSIKKEVSEAVDAFPLLARCLFSPRDDPPVAVVQHLDVEMPEKLGHLPALVTGFLEIHAMVKAHDRLMDQAAEAVLSSLELSVRKAFEEAWNVCRHGHRVECQRVDDLGDVSNMTVKDLVWIHEAGDFSPMQAILQTLVEAHNKDIEVLEKALKPRLDDVGPPELFPLDSVSQVKAALIPWRATKTWLLANLSAFSSDQRQASIVEGLLALKLCASGPKAKLSLDSFPKVHDSISGIVQVSLDETVLAIPRSVERELEEWVKSNGDMRENFIRCREWVQKLAARVQHSAGKISHGCALSHDFGIPSPPSPLAEMIRAGSPMMQLKVCHLTSLQRLFNSRLQYLAEDNLHAVYRDPLPSTEDTSALLGALAAADRHVLMQLLIDVVQRLPHENPWCDLTLSEFFEAEGVSEDNPSLLQATDGLCFKHLFHTVKALRGLSEMEW